MHTARPLSPASLPPPHPSDPAADADADALPLLPRSLGRRPIAFHGGREISAAQFLADVCSVMCTLPAASHALNLCEGRYAFAVAFAAVIARGQCNVLPHTRIAPVCNRIAADYPGSYALFDGTPRDLAALAIPRHRVELAGEVGAARDDAAVPMIPAAHVSAIAFTSGSTGQPQANAKPWGALVDGAHAAAEQFSLAAPQGGGRPPALVATVPPQHMYGLETSIMLPLAARGSFHAGRPLYPADVAQALAEVPAPRVLITTPLHLRACVDSGVAWPEVAKVISATAPLPRALAARVEARFATEVSEIFGFSEAGSVASRRTVSEDSWRLYRNVRFEAGAGDELCIGGGHVPRPVPLTDRVEILGDGRFRLAGRHGDIVNVAGKRVSLGELNATLMDIEGLDDGVFVLPQERGDGVSVTRLAAFVVAPGMTREAVARAIAERVDPVFRPRPLRLLAALPRNSIGKLSSQALQDMLGGAGP